MKLVDIAGKFGTVSGGEINMCCGWIGKIGKKECPNLYFTVANRMVNKVVKRIKRSTNQLKSNKTSDSFTD